MPNPFVQLPPNRGIEAPDRLTPVIEEYASQDDNRPYIGSIDHGVDAGDPVYNQELDDDFNEPGEAEYDVPEAEKPIPVRIVSGDTGTEIKAFRVYRTYAPAFNPAQIVNRHDSRTSLKIKNLGSVTIWFGNDAGNANSMHGYPLPGGSETSLTTTMEVYAVAEGPDSIAIAVMADYTVST